MIIDNVSYSKLYLALLIKMFDRFDLRITDGDDLNLYKIPLTIGSASRLYKKLNSKTEKVTYRAPIISLDFVRYDPKEDRRVGRLNRRQIVQLPDGENIRIHRAGLAYDFKYKLILVAKTMSDLTSITEGIIREFHNGIRYLDFKTIFNDTVSTPIRLESIENLSERNDSEFNKDNEYSMEFDVIVEGIIENITPMDARKIEKIDMILQQFKGDVVAELDRFVIMG